MMRAFLCVAVLGTVAQLSDAAATAAPVTGTTAPGGATGTTAPAVPAANQVKGTIAMTASDTTPLDDPATMAAFKKAIVKTIAQKANVVESLVSVILRFVSRRRRLGSGNLAVDFTITAANEAQATAARNALKSDPVGDFEPALNKNLAAELGDSAPTVSNVDSQSIDMSQPVTTSTDGGGWPWWAWFLLGLGICCCLSICCGASGALLSGRKAKAHAPQIVPVRHEAAPLVTGAPQQTFAYAQPAPVATTMRVVPTVATTAMGSRPPMAGATPMATATVPVYGQRPY